MLLTKGLSFSRHRGVIAAFDQHFAREGLLPSELHRTLQTAFDLRNLGDYSTEPFASESAEGVLGNAREFLDAVEGYQQSAL